MSMARILTETELRKAVQLDLAAIDCVESAFIALVGGEVVMPPILSMAIADHHGEVDVKTAYMPALESFAIKISPGFFNNPKIGLPSTSGLMILFSAKTGVLEALLLDNGYLTDIRTAAAGAVAARHLARQDASKVCIIGSGMQARLQLKALTLVRPIRSVRFWARDLARAEQLASEVAVELGIEAIATADAGAAVRSADIVVTTTPATRPVIRAEWLQPGQHLTAMGSDQATKNEIEPECIARADLYVPDRQSQTSTLGELRTAIAAGLVAPDRQFAELGAIAKGSAEGRKRPEDITIADLTGTGVQDTAIATLARQRAEALGLGTNFNSKA